MRVPCMATALAFGQPHGPEAREYAIAEDGDATQRRYWAVASCKCSGALNFPGSVAVWHL